MKLSRKQLHQPVELVCRRVVLDLLESAAKQRERLGRADASDALHGFRVSIRRLRTYLGAYGVHLPKSLRKKARRKLGALTEATNRGRDDEVHILWLERQLRQRVPQLARDGLTLVLEELARHKGLRKEELQGVTTQFERLDAKTREQLQVTEQAVKVDSEGRALSFGAGTAQVAAAQAELLSVLLAEISSPSDRRAAHRARLVAKRLRYVLEPVRQLVGGGTRAVGKLKQLQDMLGELRDAQNLERSIRSNLEQAVMDWTEELAGSPVSRATVPDVRRHTKQERACRALAAAIQRVRKDQERLYRRLERAWLQDSSLAFFVLIHDIVDELRSGRRQRAAKGSPPPEPEVDAGSSSAAEPAAEPGEPIAAHRTAEPRGPSTAVLAAASYARARTVL